MQAKHTPGPWVADGAAVTAPARHAASQRIADCRALLPDAELRANAALIAAAPDLLAALQDLTERYERMLVESRITKRDADTMRDMLPHYTEQARAAIARAIGEA